MWMLRVHLQEREYYIWVAAGSGECPFAGILSGYALDPIGVPTTSSPSPSFVSQLVQNMVDEALYSANGSSTTFYVTFLVIFLPFFSC